MFSLKFIRIDANEILINKKCGKDVTYSGNNVTVQPQHIVIFVVVLNLLSDSVIRVRFN